MFYRIYPNWQNWRHQVSQIHLPNMPNTWDTPYPVVSFLLGQQLWALHFSKPLSSGSMENFWMLSHSSWGGSFSGSLSGSKRIYCPLMLQPRGMFMRGTTLLGSGGVSDSHITNHLGLVIQTFLLHAGRASKTQSPQMHLPSEITLHSDSVLSRPMRPGIFISSLWVRPVLGKLRLHAINWC